MTLEDFFEKITKNVASHH